MIACSDGTPTAYFYNDQASVWGYSLANTKGRLSHTWTWTANSATTMYSYDAAGRVTDFWQCTPIKCASGSFWDMHYTYDLAGDISSWTHPGGFTVTHTLSNVQQITQVATNVVDPGHPSSLGFFTYTAFRAVASLANCRGAGCERWETYDYNSRLQPVRIQLGTSATPNANSCLMYNYYSGVANPTTCAVRAPPPGSGGNNANVRGYLYQDNSTLRSATRPAIRTTR